MPEIIQPTPEEYRRVTAEHPVIPPEPSAQLVEHWMDCAACRDGCWCADGLALLEAAVQQ